MGPPHPRAERSVHLHQLQPRPLSWPLVDLTFDGVVLLGHAAAALPRSVTMNSRRRMWIAM
jgi:hypothetical protein